MVRLAILGWVPLYAVRLALNDGKLPPTTQLENAERETALLLQTEPWFGGVLAFDSRLSSLNLWLPCLKGSKWPHPERFQAYADPALGELLEAKEYDSEERWTYCAVSWLTSNRLAEAFVRACPPDSNGLECVAGMRREVERQTSKMTLPIMLFGALVSGRPVEHVRDTIVGASIAAAALPAYEKYARLWACNSFLIAALRLQLRLLIHARRFGRCPSAKELRSEEWADVVTDPNVGQPMHITIERDLYTVGTAPFPTSEGVDQDYCQDHCKKAYVIRCRTGQRGDHGGNDVQIAR